MHLAYSFFPCNASPGRSAGRRAAGFRPRWRRGRLACLSLGLLLAGGGGRATACSVPVFRYALERWAADPYLAVVFHQGALTPAQAACVTDLDRAGLAGQLSANLAVRTVDLATTTEVALRRLWSPLAATTSLPALVLLYPPGHGMTAPAWRGPLTAESVRQLLDSPGRREIARRLLRGDSAVWVLLESGDVNLDTQAAAVLAARLKHLEATLALPELNPADLLGGAAAAPDKLKVNFSTLRLSRRDPAEAPLVRMLLHTEEDLATSREPIVFPVFGQGRVLYALVGPGINPAMIDEAGGFLTGACSCVVKEQNPGIDLLLAVDWARLVEPLIRSDEASPPLPGLADFAAAPAAGGAPPRAPTGAAAPAASASAAAAIPPADAAAAGAGLTSPLLPGLLLVGGLGFGVVLGATWWLLRRR